MIDFNVTSSNFDINNIEVGTKLIQVKFKDNCELIINTDEATNEELSQYFTFTVPDYHIRKKKNPHMWNWDGKIRLYLKRSKTLPFGLIKKLYVFCKERKYKLELDPKILSQKNSLSTIDLQKFIDSVACKLTPRDYQMDATLHAINNIKSTILAPTGSGKSLIIYLFVRWALHATTKKIILIVPNIGLVEQMYNDFLDYGSTIPVHKITAGKPKNSDERVYISTYQSLLSCDENYFSQFETLIIDEAHSINVDSKSLAKLSAMCKDCMYRLGTTATLKLQKVNILSVEGILGPVYKSASTKELQDTGILSPLEVRMLYVDYPKDVTDQIERLDWDKQQTFTEMKENPRNKIITDLALATKKNTLVLFRSIEHGTHLYDTLLLEATHRSVFYVDGQITGEDRMKVVQELERSENAILVASLGTFAQGINVKNLHNVIFAASGKSEIRIPQSIGRSLRKHITKETARLYDLVDNFGYLKKHATQRKEMYSKEQFPIVEKTIKLEQWCKDKNVSFF